QKVALKEIKDSRYDIAEILKVVKTVKNYNYYSGISIKPSTKNYIFVMDLFDDDLHNYLTKTFWDLEWETKTKILTSIAESLESLHAKNLVHCDLRSENILLNYNEYFYNELILNYNPKNNETYGSIPYIPPEVLKGNDFIREGDIYSFGGI
ncbi:10898_t:CDS:2, partial [Diversispora eburnea]